MNDMTDEEMTVEEFDSLLAAGTGVALHVNLQRHSLYRVAVSNGVGFSAGRSYEPTVRALGGVSLAHA